MHVVAGSCRGLVNVLSLVVAIAIWQGGSIGTAQDGGGGLPPGGGTTPPATQNPPVNQTPTTTTQAGNAQQGEPVDLTDNPVELGGNTENLRNQGFIGSTAQKITDLGFTGAASETSGPPLVDGASFGGNINSGFNRGSTPSGGGGGGGGFGRGGFTGAGQNGVTIQRKIRAVRARLNPQFTVPQVEPVQIVNHFASNFRRQPANVNVKSKFSVLIENKTATLSGTVGSADEANRIVRQLRLQPGVYKIVNELKW